MTEKQKESEQAELILAVLVFGTLFGGILVLLAYLAYDLHPIVGWLVIIIEIAGVNAIVKRYEAVKEKEDNSNTQTFTPKND